MKRRLDDTVNQLEQMKKKLDSKKKTMSKLKKKVESLDTIVSSLKEHDLISDKVARTLEKSFSGVSFNLIMKIFYRQCSDTIRVVVTL